MSDALKPAYAASIAEVLGPQKDDQGNAVYDPRHVEAFMRLECGTLDGLSRERFEVECRIAADCARTDLDTAERLALSYGF